MPPAMHIVTTAYFTRRRRPSSSTCPAEARAGHAEGMADGDRAAVDVEQFIRNAKPVPAIDRLRGERLVQLPQADVFHLEPVALEQLGNGEDRADAHLIGLAARDREAAECAQRLDAGALGGARLHHHRRRRRRRTAARRCPP